MFISPGRKKGKKGKKEGETRTLGRAGNSQKGGYQKAVDKSAGN